MMKKIILAYLILLAGGCDADRDAIDKPGPFDPAFAGSLVVEGDEAGRIVSPGGTVSLSVVVRGPDGAPRSGVTVAFAAPRGGPTGTFDGAMENEPTLMVTATDPSGRARARLRTNDKAGLYLVEALASDTARATFAITQAPGVTAPADMVAARRAAVTALAPPAGVEANLVHGPFVVVPGTTILSGGPEVQPVSLVPSTESFFFIADDLPGALLAHDFRYLLSSSTQISASAAVAATWEPVVTLPGQPATRPGPPGRSYAESLLPRAAARALRAQAEGDACAILSYGPPDTWLERDARRMHDLLVNELGAASVDADLSGPDSFEDLRMRIENAKKRGCKKVFLVILAHGGSGAEGRVQLRSGNDKRTDPSPELYFWKWSELAEVVTDNLQGTEVVIFLSSCFSGQAIQHFQGKGLTGFMITAASAQEAKGLPVSGEAYVTDLERYYREHDGSLMDAAAWIADHGSDLTKSSKPLSTELRALPDPYDAPNIDIAQVGSIVGQTFLRPESLAGDPTHVMGTVVVQSPLIASLATRPIDVVIAPGKGSMALQFQGLEKGVTRYTLTLAGLKNVYQGTGTITVAGEAEIEVTGSSGALANGANEQVGTKAPAVAFSQSYVIENVGTVALMLGEISFPITDNCKVTVSTAPVASVEAYTGKTQLVLSVTPLVPGPFLCRVQIPNNDRSDESPFGFSISGTTPPQPDLVVGVPYEFANGATHDVRERAVGATFEVRHGIVNVGNVDLAIGGATISPATFMNCTAAVIQQPPATLAPSASATLVLAIRPDGPGPFSFNLSIASDDPDEDPFGLTTVGTARLSPEIDVVGFESYGTDAVGTKPEKVSFTRTYTIENEGAVSLVISGATISSQTNCAATVTLDPSTQVAPLGSTSVAITVTPLEPGAFSCNFRIASDDLDESSYLVTISGTAIVPCVHENGVKLIAGKKIYRVPVNVGCSGDQVCQAAGLTCVGVPTLSPPSAACTAFHPGTPVTSSYNGWQQSVYCDGTAIGLACENKLHCHDCPECGSTGLQCNDPNSVQLSELYVECR